MAEEPTDTPAADATTPAAETKEEDADKPKDDKGEEEVKPTTARDQTPGGAGGPCLSPTPSGEDLPPEESNKIISLTLEILQLAQKKVDEQKIASHSLSYMLLRIKESLDAYFNNYIPMLNTFLVQAEQITADYYARMCCALPQYGDHVKALERHEEETVEVGFANPVAKQDLTNIVVSVTDNYHAAAMFVKAGRANYKDINGTQVDRKEMVIKVVRNIPDWLKLQDEVTKGLEDIRDSTFKISAYVEFLKHGESKVSPALDLSKLAQKEEPNKGPDQDRPGTVNQPADD